MIQQKLLEDLFLIYNALNFSLYFDKHQDKAQDQIELIQVIIYR